MVRLRRNHNPKMLLLLWRTLLRLLLLLGPTVSQHSQKRRRGHKTLRLHLFLGLPLGGGHLLRNEEKILKKLGQITVTLAHPTNIMLHIWLEEQSNPTGFTSNWPSTGSPISSPQGENELENDGENDREQMEKVDTNKEATKEGENELEVMAANAEKVKKEAAEEVNEDVEDSPEDGEALTRTKRLAKPSRAHQSPYVL
ncbi:hypothetical protein HID58_056079, partial [Brassica napus]